LPMSTSNVSTLTTAKENEDVDLKFGAGFILYRDAHSKSRDGACFC
ncbi:14768_t:CDS:1, partial [Racocetra fulgida]